MSANPRDVGPTLDPEDPTGPGSQLREARHRANLSVEEVATQLRLDRRTVRALEEGDFKHLPAPTFIRGYIRSYARLLGLPPGPILEAYDFQGFTPPAILADISQRPQARVSDISVRLATYLVAAGLVLMVVMWWHSRESAPAPPETEPLAAVPEAAAPAATPEENENLPPLATLDPPAPAPEIAAGSGESDPTPPQSGDGERTAQALSPSPPAEGEASTRVALGNAAAAAEPDNQTADGASAAENPSAALPAPQTTSAPAVPPAARAGDPTASLPVLGPDTHLSIRFQADSWVEVYDAAGVRHVFELANAGDDVNARGEAPFHVLLGYAEGATVNFEGERYDISRFIRGNTARFLIGPDGVSKALPPPEDTSGSEPQATEAEPAAQAGAGMEN